MLYDFSFLVSCLTRTYFGHKIAKFICILTVQPFGTLGCVHACHELCIPLQPQYLEWCSIGIVYSLVEFTAVNLNNIQVYF